jgi:hypothetical protein
MAVAPRRDKNSVDFIASESPHSEAVAPARTRPDRVVCILGMHRSGTSCLTGSLQQQGLFLGTHNLRAPDNPRGNRENKDTQMLQKDILEQSGGSWDAPPPTVEWRPEHFELAQEILAEHAEHPVWGFKDPRTLLTMEGWKILVPDLQPVGIFRHPLRVAQSLKARDHFDREKSLSLWLTYNSRLVDFHRQDPFPVVSFDEEAPVLQAKLRQAGELIGLMEATTDEPFFTDELRFAQAEGGALPADVERLYEELRTLAL